MTLRPGDTEAQSFATQLRNPTPAGAEPGSRATPSADTQGPMTRIKRGYSEAGFRQAAFEMEQVQQMRLASLPPQERAGQLVKDGDQFFQRGLVLEAEREYREALKGGRAVGTGACRPGCGQGTRRRGRCCPAGSAYVDSAGAQCAGLSGAGAAGPAGQPAQRRCQRCERGSAGRSGEREREGMKLALERRGQTLP